MTGSPAELGPWLSALARNDWTEAESRIHAAVPAAALAASPALVAATRPLATQALIQKGQQAVQASALGSAEALFLALSTRFPNEFEPWLNLARVRAQRGLWAGALLAAREALRCRQDRVEIWQFLLWLAPRAGVERDEQRRWAERWCELEPTRLQAWLSAARLELEAGDYEAVHQAVNRALQIAPDSLPALWLSMLTPDRRNMRDALDQQRFLTRWRQGLDRLESLPLDGPDRAGENLDVLGSQPNFYLAYLGEAFREDLRRFGTQMQRMAVSGLGHLQTERRRITRSRRRIGVVSRYFPEHAISKLFLPLFLNLDPEHFEVIGICPNTYRDAWVDRARQRFAAYQDGEGSLGDWAARIAALDCDVLIYPDLGMNAITHALASLRLAPVQAMMWGHPISSGLPNMDVMLSSAAMEPADGQSHYVEQLYCLPGLGCGFERPVFASSSFRLDRQPGRVIALCAQMWAKLGPHHDPVFAQLLARVPNLDLHLTPAVSGEGLNLLTGRLQQACAAAGVAFEERITIHPRLSSADFHAAQGQADFLLDSIGWSGGVTAFEAFAQQRPIVSLPGKLMRARHTAAMLSVMELPELIAADIEDYLNIATRLAQSPQLLTDLQTCIAARNHRLFAHDATHAAFADWLANVVPTT